MPAESTVPVSGVEWAGIGVNEHQKKKAQRCPACQQAPGTVLLQSRTLGWFSNFDGFRGLFFVPYIQTYYANRQTDTCEAI